jgi:DNA-binding response OmpR family regulator
MKPSRILFVDDEPTIRATMPLVLRKQGYEVTVAATVKEALEAIHREEFDLLLSDLNIGQPGDGFTVVSAMRRSQPQALTLIITGYPDFDTALQAIRSQVDDYVTKPADIPKLISTIREKLLNRPRRASVLPTKRVYEVLHENKQAILETFIQAVEGNAELSSIPLSQKQRSNHLGVFLDDLIKKLAEGRTHDSPKAEQGAVKHGQDRQQQGYSIPQLVLEYRCLQSVLSATLQEKLLVIDISTLIPDILHLGEGLNVLLETSIRAFETQARAVA